MPLEWNNKKVEERVAWFQHETDPQLNSNVYQVAENLVQKHFPGICQKSFLECLKFFYKLQIMRQIIRSNYFCPLH